MKRQSENHRFSAKKIGLYRVLVGPRSLFANPAQYVEGSNLPKYKRFNKSNQPEGIFFLKNLYYW